MAPELLLALIENDGGVLPISPASDVYAFDSVCCTRITMQSQSTS